MQLHLQLSSVEHEGELGEVRNYKAFIEDENGLIEIQLEISKVNNLIDYSGIIYFASCVNLYVDKHDSNQLYLSQISYEEGYGHSNTRGISWYKIEREKCYKIKEEELPSVELIDTVDAALPDRK